MIQGYNNYVNNAPAPTPRPLPRFNATSKNENNTERMSIVIKKYED